MKISITLATFNGALHLEEQLASYLAQDRQPDELVVCDDCSQDGTMELLEKFKNKAPFRVKLSRNPKNVGFVKNFENALRLSGGDVVLLSDQDDVWARQKIAVVEAFFSENPNTWLVVHDGRLIDENGVFHGATKGSQVIAGYGSDDPLCTGALTAIRRELLALALPFPIEISGHDHWLHDLARYVGKRFVLADILQEIRRHPDNTSSWVASSVKPVNRFTVFKQQLGTDIANSYDDRLAFNANLLERLESMNSSGLNNIDFRVISSAVAHLTRERGALNRRAALAEAGRWNRKAQAFSLLVRGDYKFFNGLKSFARDIAR